MTRPTLRNLVDLPSSPAPLSESALVLIDCQNTYTYGVMELDGVQAALEEAAALLDRARAPAFRSSIFSTTPDRVRPTTLPPRSGPS